MIFISCNHIVNECSVCSTVCRQYVSHASPTIKSQWGWVWSRGRWTQFGSCLATSSGEALMYSSSFVIQLVTVILWTIVWYNLFFHGHDGQYLLDSMWKNKTLSFSRARSAKVLSLNSSSLLNCSSFIFSYFFCLIHLSACSLNQR